jgi:hypothetical protein
MLSSMLLAFSVVQSTGFEDFELETDDHIHLLQVQAKKHNRTAMDLPVSHHFIFGQCATFGGAADIVGTGAFNPRAQETTFGYCRCWGDTHCNAVPFDAETSTQSENGDHYQYDGPGASRFAKAADGSWEIQIFQCSRSSTLLPGGQVGIAVRVGGTVVEAGTANKDATVCYVNGELKPAGYEVHLPTGFHFKCPEAAPRCDRGPAAYCRQRTTANGAFCAVKDGQFVAHTNHFEWGTQANQVLAVPKTVDVQEAGTVCYDPSNKVDQPMHRGGDEISNDAIVSPEEVIFSQTLIDYMKSASVCNLQDPPQSGVPAGEPADPQQLCDDKGPDAWQHAQDVCSPLQENHPSFYNDCLVDECVRAVDSEEEEIEEIAEADEPADDASDEASAQGDPHMVSPRGSRYDLDPSMLNH